MFTGIVEELGEVVGLERGERDARLVVRGPLVASDAHPGDSIAVSGVCLTVTSLGGDGTFAADLMPETLEHSTLGALVPGEQVNLERAMGVDGRFGGHLVQGHVDGVGTVLSRDPGERWDVVTIALPAQLARYVAHKGSVTVSGVSLTVSAVADDRFEVSLIPTTLGSTTLGALAPGAPVNLEVDVLAKYTERLLAVAR